ncbi:phosphodiesterase [Alsobacter soli]|uniref:Phosphodiesterase n=1 Tax=Alsobacter soli TaxID=2109933 RepID=A0A2T1HYZ6_9HYPH|nr:phosphodiesterase [Alsobacter soli]PSC06891.1 phosphodiesterase [Alsobacter soli]
MTAPAKLIVLTDLHMVPEGGDIIGLDPFARLATAIDHINRHHGDAARVVVTGDLAHRGDPASYARVRTLLGRLRPPLSLTIGNHDDRQAFLEAFPGAARDSDGFVQEALKVGGYTLILLDTVEQGRGEGRLCEARLAWLRARLAEGGPSIVFMHHPPHPTGFPGMDAIALQNGDAFHQTLRGHDVRLVVAGHVHRTISGVHAGTPFAIFKSPVHQQPMDLEARDTHLSVDEPGAYGILLLGPDGVIVHTDDYELSRPPGRA